MKATARRCTSSLQTSSIYMSVEEVHHIICMSVEEVHHIVYMTVEEVHHIVCMSVEEVHHIIYMSVEEVHHIVYMSVEEVHHIVCMSVEVLKRYLGWSRLMRPRSNALISNIRMQWIMRHNRLKNRTTRARTWKPDG